jgi:hypothetical protein
LWPALLAQTDFPLPTGPLPADVPWWAWLASTVLAVVLGTFLPKTYEFLLNRIKTKGQAAADADRAAAELRRDSRQAETNEHKAVIEEYKKLVAFQDRRIKRMEDRIEKQEEEVGVICKREQECLSRCDRLSAENHTLRARLDDHEQAMQDAGIKVRGATPPRRAEDCHEP